MNIVRNQREDDGWVMVRISTFYGYLLLFTESHYFRITITPNRMMYAKHIVIYRGGQSLKSDCLEGVWGKVLKFETTSDLLCFHQIYKLLYLSASCACIAILKITDKKSFA